MNKLIMLIGPDRCGKTSIALELSKIYNIPYYKNNLTKNYFKQNIVNESVLYEGPFFIDFLKQVPISLIIDRGYPCQYAYSKALSREFDENLIWWMDEEFSNLNLKIIYCLKEDYKLFDDEIIKIQEIEKIKKYYFDFLFKSTCEWISLDTTNENLQEQLKKIGDFIK